MLAKMKAVTTKTQNNLVNVNNIPCMRQQGAESVRLNLGRLKGAARHCNFNLTAGHTSNMDKMILHTQEEPHRTAN